MRRQRGRSARLHFMIVLLVFFLIMFALALFKYCKIQPKVEMLGRTPRSSQWRKLRNLHLVANPCCAICGSDENLTVHHIKSFSENPELELFPENLITLCENRNLNCHFVFGHHMRWTNINDTLVSDLNKIRSLVKGD